jgi:DNA recombination protein RmuC
VVTLYLSLGLGVAAAGIAVLIIVVLRLRVSSAVAVEQARNLLEQAHARTAELLEAREQQRAAEKQLAETATRLDAERQAFEMSRKQLAADFENLANAIFEDKSKKFTDQNKQNMDGLLTPLREQIGDFRKKVEDAYDKESKDRRDLFNELCSLKLLNQQMSQDAVNLTNALKGDAKVMGNWGEAALEKILELSGLQEGIEFKREAAGTTDDGRAVRPDVMVYLPEGKNIIVDSKVSLAAYERCCSAADDADRGRALDAHVGSVRGHIEELSGKDYSRMKDIASLDFVVMFIPVEPAYFLALRADPDLLSFANKNNIVIACPSTLLITLKTVANIWRIERQNRNALEIAKRAGDLCDKFAGFCESLAEVRDQIAKASASCDTAISQLATGKGSIVSRVQFLKTLGVKGKKELPKELLEKALPDEEEIPDRS